jgi:hypothetical protein
MNNNNFNNYLPLIYPNEFEIKKTTISDISAAYILLNIDSNGRLTTIIYDILDDLDFDLVDFHFLCTNIPFSPAYGVRVSQLIQFSRACFVYENFSK